jgi:hypothetical protein
MPPRGAALARDHARVLEGLYDLLDERNGDARSLGDVVDSVRDAFVVQGQIKKDAGRVSGFCGKFHVFSGDTG